MFTIKLPNLQLLDKLFPEDSILNLKPLSQTTVRVQLAKKTEIDTQRLVHSNSRVFLAKHPDARVADIYISDEEENIRIVPHGNDILEFYIGEAEEGGQRTLRDMLIDVAKGIAKANGIEV